MQSEMQSKPTKKSTKGSIVVGVLGAMVILPIIIILIMSFIKPPQRQFITPSVTAPVSPVTSVTLWPARPNASSQITNQSYKKFKSKESLSSKNVKV